MNHFLSLRQIVFNEVEVLTFNFYPAHQIENFLEVELQFKIIKLRFKSRSETSTSFTLGGYSQKMNKYNPPEATIESAKSTPGPSGHTPVPPAAAPLTAPGSSVEPGNKNGRGGASLQVRALQLSTHVP